MSQHRQSLEAIMGTPEIQTNCSECDMDVAIGVDALYLNPVMLEVINLLATNAATIDTVVKALKAFGTRCQ